MMKKTLLAGLSIAVLAACATPATDAPIAVNFPMALQHKSQATVHWSLIANDVAQQIKLAVGDDNPMLHVAKPHNHSDFSRAFHKLLVSALVNKGLLVSPSGSNSQWQIDIDTQLLKFSPNRHQNSQFVSTTALATGLLAINGVTTRSSADHVDSLAKSAMIDWNDGYLHQLSGGETPQYELVVTVSAVNHSQYTVRRTNIYYISDADSGMYASPPKNIVVTGGL